MSRGFTVYVVFDKKGQSDLLNVGARCFFILDQFGVDLGPPLDFDLGHTIVQKTFLHP